MGDFNDQVQWIYEFMSQRNKLEKLEETEKNAMSGMENKRRLCSSSSINIKLEEAFEAH